MAETHTYVQSKLAIARPRASSINGENEPRPKGDEEAKPGKMKHSSVDIDGIQDRDRARLAGDGVDVGRLPQKFEIEHANLFRLGALIGLAAVSIQGVKW